MKKNELKKLIKEELKIALNEADYSVENLKLTVYEDIKEIDISSGPGKRITIKLNQVNRLIDRLKEVTKNYARNHMTFPKD